MAARIGKADTGDTSLNIGIGFVLIIVGFGISSPRYKAFTLVGGVIMIIRALMTQSDEDSTDQAQMRKIVGSKKGEERAHSGEFDGEEAKRLQFEVRHMHKSGSWDESKDIFSKTTYVLAQYTDKGNQLNLKCDECEREFEGELRSIEFLTNEKKRKDGMHKKIRIYSWVAITGYYLIYVLRMAFQDNKGDRDGLQDDILLSLGIGWAIQILIIPGVYILSHLVIGVFSSTTWKLRFDEHLFHLDDPNAGPHSIIFYPLAREIQESGERCPLNIESFKRIRVAASGSEIPVTEFIKIFQDDVEPRDRVLNTLVKSLIPLFIMVLIYDWTSSNPSLYFYVLIIIFSLYIGYKWSSPSKTEFRINSNDFVFRSGHDHRHRSVNFTGFSHYLVAENTEQIDMLHYYTTKFFYSFTISRSEFGMSDEDFDMFVKASIHNGYVYRLPEYAW